MEQTCRTALPPTDQYCSHPKELTADQANLFDPYLVHPERGIAALDSIVGRDLSRP
jgi:hypothetical protein